MSYLYTIETGHKLDLLSMLDAVAALVEPDPHHKPSTDTLMFKMSGSNLNTVAHNRLDLEISVEIA